MNYFEVFELPKLLGIDTKALEKKFHELSRKFHPDYFSTASADEKSRALRMTALLNDAYRTLKHPTRRVEYLLSLYGFKADGSKVPQSLLMEVFEINEQLEEIKMAGSTDSSQLQDLRREIQSKADLFVRELNEAMNTWDALIQSNATDQQRRTHLTKISEILSESAYIRNLEDEIENRQGHYFRGSN